MNGRTKDFGALFSFLIIGTVSAACSRASILCDAEELTGPTRQTVVESADGQTGLAANSVVALASPGGRSSVKCSDVILSALALTPAPRRADEPRSRDNLQP